jgi:hypothetical protein
LAVSTDTLYDEPIIGFGTSAVLANVLGATIDLTDSTVKM